MNTPLRDVLRLLDAATSSLRALDAHASAGYLRRAWEILERRPLDLIERTVLGKPLRRMSAVLPPAPSFAVPPIRAGAGKASEGEPDGLRAAYHAIAQRVTG